MGFIFISSGILEIYETTIESFLGFTIGSHHGVILFGIFHILRALCDMLEYSTEIVETDELEKQLKKSNIFSATRLPSLDKKALAPTIFHLRFMVVVAQLVRASVCGIEGRGFESRLPPHFQFHTELLNFSLKYLSVSSI